MNITELITALESVKSKSGNLRVYLEVDETEHCDKCGSEVSHTYDGFLERVATINLHASGRCVWLWAKRDNE